MINRLSPTMLDFRPQKVQPPSLKSVLPSQQPDTISFKGQEEKLSDKLPSYMSRAMGIPENASLLKQGKLPKLYVLPLSFTSQQCEQVDKAVAKLGETLEQLEAPKELVVKTDAFIKNTLNKIIFSGGKEEVIDFNTTHLTTSLAALAGVDTLDQFDETLANAELAAKNPPKTYLHLEPKDFRLPVLMPSEEKTEIKDNLAAAITTIDRLNLDNDQRRAFRTFVDTAVKTIELAMGNDIHSKGRPENTDMVEFSTLESCKGRFVAGLIMLATAEDEAQFKKTLRSADGIMQLSYENERAKFFQQIRRM